MSSGGAAGAAECGGSAERWTLLLETRKCKPDEFTSPRRGADAAASGAAIEWVPLKPYRKVAYIGVPRRSVEGTPFMKLARTEGDLGADYRVDVDTEDEMNALLEVMACMGSTPRDRSNAAGQLELNVGNMFAILRAAQTLEQKWLCRQCEIYVAANLTEASVVPALRYVAEHPSPSLRRACYYWLKQHALTVARAASRHEGAPVWLDDAARRVHAPGGVSAALSVLDEEIHFERRRKARYFVPKALQLREDGTEADLGVGFDGTVKCFIERFIGAEDAAAARFARFVMRREGGSSPFVMAAQHTAGSSEFILSLDEEDFREDGPHFLGKVAGNFLGTQFTLTDFGVPGGSPREAALPALRRREHVVVNYKVNVMGRVPNSMSVDVLVAPVTEEESETVREAAAAADALTAVGLPSGGAAPSSAVLRTRQPRWNAELDAWTMDFKGRVKLASKKNFQLEIDGDDRVLMLFGKVSRNRFSLDYQSPMTAVSSFAVALSTFSDKLMVT